MNYYPFHIGDYLSATRHLSWEEDMAYRRLLDTYYTTEKPLPADVRACCRLVLAQTDAQRDAVRVVLEEFFEPTDNGWTNSRADAELANAQGRQQAARDKANKRWHKPQPERSNADAMPQHPPDDATASAIDAKAMLPVPVPVPVKDKDLSVPDFSLAAAAPPEKPKRQAKAREILFDEFSAACRAAGEPAIPDDDPIYAYAEKAELSVEMIHLCWSAFRTRHSGGTKKYADWRAAFRNAVRGNYEGIWFVDGQGRPALTTVGKLTEKVAT